MSNRRSATGTFELPIPAAKAIGYFTPEGERDWAPGWNPTYPAGSPSETRGTVFITSHGDQDTIWTIHHIDRDGFTSAYSRCNVGNWAGTVQVRCRDQGAESCVVTVEYDTTVLPGGDTSILHHFDEAHYEAMMSEWATRVTAVL
jgi:hypothetical protein